MIFPGFGGFRAPSPQCWETFSYLLPEDFLLTQSVISTLVI